MFSRFYFWGPIIAGNAWATQWPRPYGPHERCACCRGASRLECAGDGWAPLEIPIPSFRRKPESRRINDLDTGFRRRDGLLEMPISEHRYRYRFQPSPATRCTRRKLNRRSSSPNTSAHGSYGRRASCGLPDPRPQPKCHRLSVGSGQESRNAVAAAIGDLGQWLIIGNLRFLAAGPATIDPEYPFKRGLSCRLVREGGASDYLPCERARPFIRSRRRSIAITAPLTCRTHPLSPRRCQAAYGRFPWDCRGPTRPAAQSRSAPPVATGSTLMPSGPRRR